MSKLKFSNEAILVSTSSPEYVLRRDFDYPVVLKVTIKADL